MPGRVVAVMVELNLEVLEHLRGFSEGKRCPDNALGTCEPCHSAEESLLWAAMRVEVEPTPCEEVVAAVPAPPGEKVFGKRLKRPYYESD